MGLLNRLFNRSKVNFISEVPPEDKCRLCNPDRGWYRLFPFVIGNPIDWEEVLYSLNDEERLVLIRIDIGNYSEKELTGEALTEIRGILNYFCNHDKDVILRVTYDSEGCAMVREPSLASTVVLHMEQISGIVKEYGDRIFVYQGLLVGNWGEMHSSRYASEKYLKEIYQKAPRNCFVAVRTPKIGKMLVGGNNKLGLFDDAMFASENDLGTYVEPDDREYENRNGLNAPNGGEAVYGEGYSDRLSREEVIEEMSRKHVSYLNVQYDRRLLDKWQQDSKLYDTIENRMGYRFVVKSALFSTKNNCLTIKIKNVGFAPVYRRTTTKLIIIEDNGNKTEIKTDIDLMQQDSDGMITAAVPFDSEMSLLKGKIYLRTVRNYDSCRILYANTGCTEGDVYLGILA